MQLLLMSSMVCVYIQVEAVGDEDAVADTITVTVNVLDVNNNAPRFNQEVYTAVIRERRKPGELHVTLYQRI